MKRIITTTSVFEPCTEMTGIIKRLAKLGYDGADIAFDYCTQKPDYPFMTDKYEDWAEQVRETAENRSITITHAHAPFDASATGEIVERTFRAAEIMGVKYIVAHPVWRRSDKTIIDHPDEFIETNLPLAKAMTESAQSHNLTLLSENLLWGASTDPKNIADLAAETNSPNFGWCLDTGHAHAFGVNLNTETLTKLKTPPKSLHIQDTHGDKRDEHLIPYDGTIDWKELCKALNAIGYTGEVVLEAHHQSLELPDSERDTLLADLLTRAARIQKMLE